MPPRLQNRLFTSTADERMKFLSPNNEGRGKIKAGTICPHEVAATIEDLKFLLQKHYGYDFSFTIVGDGRILAASNNSLGNISPISEE